MIKKVLKGGDDVEHETERICRLGKYIKGSTRSMKIKFWSQGEVDIIMNRTWNLAVVKIFKTYRLEEEKEKVKDVLCEEHEKKI